MHERIVSKERVIVGRVIKITLLVVLFSVLISLSYATRRSITSAQAVDSPLITITNQDRIALGLTPLMPNIKLSAAAQAKAEDIFAGQYFDHYSPTGKSPWDFILESNYGYHRAGENLALGFNDFETAETAWLNSPSHRANILNVNFSEMGVGLERGILQGKEAIVIVTMFGSP